MTDDTGRRLNVESAAWLDVERDGDRWAFVAVFTESLKVTIERCDTEAEAREWLTWFNTGESVRVDIATMRRYVREGFNANITHDSCIDNQTPG